MFGIISDRYGHHRIMVFGPVFGATAVILTGLAPAFLVFGAIVMLVILAATRVLEGASSAASVPSILGYIAMATAGNEVLRGKTSARFEAATLAGLGLGAIVGVKLFEFFENLGIGPAAFFLNAAFYGVSFLIYMFGVSDPPGEAEARAGEHVHVGPLSRPDPVIARPAPGPDLDRHQRGPRRVAEPVGLPARQGRREVPEPGADGRLHGQPDHHRGDHHRRHLRRGPASTGATGSRRTGGRRSSGTA